MRDSGALYALVGACGGAGTSTLAAALAQTIHAATGRGVLVDLDAGGGGIEVPLGIEGVGGARWPELTGARGDVDGRGLQAALPRWKAIPVVSISRLDSQAPPDDVVLDVCAGMLRSGQPVVADLPRPGAWTEAIRALLRDADAVTCVCPARVPAAAGALALVGALRQLGNRGLRLQLALGAPGPGRLDAPALAELTGCEVATVVRHDRALAAATELGAAPRRRSPVMRAARELATAIGAVPGGGR